MLKTQHHSILKTHQFQTHSKSNFPFNSPSFPSIKATNSLSFFPFFPTKCPNTCFSSWAYKISPFTHIIVTLGAVSFAFVNSKKITILTRCDLFGRNREKKGKGEKFVQIKLKEKKGFWVKKTVDWKHVNLERDIFRLCKN